MGFSEKHPAIQEALRRGLVAGAKAGVPVKADDKAAKPVLVPAVFAPPATWTVPLHVKSGDNAHEFRAKIGRAGHERRVVARCLGGATLRHLVPFAEAAAEGRAVTVALTRLGGGEMDTDGLAGAMKYVRDTVALVLGFDDNARSPLRWEYGQQPGGACGVRITLEELT